MPLAPVAYEAAARRPRTSYESRVREVLSTLGSTNPDEDIAATGPLLENSKKAKMDPAAAAGIIYATSRHRHPPTSVLRTAEEARGLDDYRRGHAAAKRMFAEHEEFRRVYTKEGEGPLVDYAVKVADAELRPGYSDSSEAWQSGFVDAIVQGARKRWPYNPTKGTYGETKSVTAAEDSSPAPCAKPARTVSDECQRLAKQIGPIRSDKELYALIAPSMRKETQETFVVVCCDVHGNLVSFTEVARGQVSRVAVDIEDVLGAVFAVRPRPTIYYVAHVHPSSKARPSEADERLTEAIRRASAVAIPNVVFGDHIIVAGGESSREYYSFADKRLKKG